MSEQIMENEQPVKAEYITLPKNIRQMGTPGEKQKVYIEDYVHTYLHTFLKEKYKEDTLRAALLLGEYRQQDTVTYSFVKGAIACDFSHLHETISAELSQAVEEYFPEWDMLGWYVSAQGVDAHIQSEIKHYYAGSDEKIPHYLIYEDELEKETDVFAWEQNALHKLTGYYIYYERNPQMQEFLIKEKGGRPQEAPTFRRASPSEGFKGQEIAKEASREHMKAFVDKVSVSNVDKGFSGKKDKKAPQRLVYAACGVVLVLLAAMGISQMGNYQSMQKIQETISNTFIPGNDTEDRLSDLSDEQSEPASQGDETADQQQEEDAPADADQQQEEDAPADADQQKEEDAPADADQQQEEDAPVDIDLQEMIPTDQDSPSSTDAQQTAVEEPDPEYYVVQKGDSLYSICRAVYENEDMVGQICELNGITNINLIYEGQKIKLP